MRVLGSMSCTRMDPSVRDLDEIKGTVYLEGTGPRYAPKKSRQKKASPFGL